MNDPPKDVIAAKSVFNALQGIGIAGIMTCEEYDRLLGGLDYGMLERERHYGHASVFSLIRKGLRFLAPMAINHFVNPLMKNSGY